MRQNHQNILTGTIRCGECGFLITAETKHKTITSTGQVKNYTYYHCTRRKREINCSQHKVILESGLELQIEQALEKYTILPEFRDWALEIIRESNDAEIDDRSKIYESQHNALTQAQKELDNLTKMRYRELIDDEAFIRERDELQGRISGLKEKLRGTTESRAEKWLELTEKTFNFATYAHKAFIAGDLQTKREILAALGQNPTLKDGKLNFQENKWLIPIAKQYPVLEKEYTRLEPTKMPMNKVKTEALTSVRAHWLRALESFRTAIWQIPGNISPFKIVNYW